jgi:hypothetical protein
LLVELARALHDPAISVAGATQVVRAVETVRTWDDERAATARADLVEEDESLAKPDRITVDGEIPILMPAVIG